MANSTARPKSHQSAKPYPDFPLTAHVSGRWCKKVRGRVLFFGKIDDPQGSLDKWLAQRDELLAGRVPRPDNLEGNTLRKLVIDYLRHKSALMDNGELSPRTFADCHRTCKSLVDHFGKHRLVGDLRQNDFAEYRVALAKNLGPVSLGNSIQKVRGVFKFALEAGMVQTPILFGPGFKRPTRKTLRLERAKKGPKLFTREDIAALLGVAGVQVKAMILLACNGGLGNSDLANMPLTSVDLESGWCDYPRPKTGIPRRFPLWPETVDALREVLAKRPEPKTADAVGLLFVTKYGGKWCKTIFEKREPVPGTVQDESAVTYRANNDNEVSKEFNKLFGEAKVARKPGLSFYTLRHVFETIAGECRDQVAVDHVMGHARDDMASVYRERVDNGRLSAVVNVVRAWLFGDKAKAKGKGKPRLKVISA